MRLGYEDGIHGSTLLSKAIMRPFPLLVNKIMQ
jgi:hypothetical protein